MQLGPMIGIILGVVVLYVCHKLVGHLQKGKTAKVILSLESIAVLLLLVTFTLGDVLRISVAINPPSGSPVRGLGWEDVAIVLTTVFTSVALFLMALWFLKRLGYDD